METQTYVIMLRPANKFGGPETEEIVSQHFEYLKNLLEKGILTLAGRFSEVLIGLAMIQTNTKDEAMAIMKNDPAIKAGIFHGELYPWRIALQAK
jgi:uncharacterized protein YciI